MIGSRVDHVHSTSPFAARVEPVPVSLREKVAFLGRPESYPHGPESVEAVETHMAWVFLAGSEAYKLKKPVRYRFLDFSTIEARRRDCEEEVRLNRRLAPDVYRGVVALRRTGLGGLVLDGSGPVADWLVHMRRLRGERMLDARIREGAVSAADVRRVAVTLARFYERAPRVRVFPEAYPGRFRREILESRRALAAQVDGLPRDLPETAGDRLLAALSSVEVLLEERALHNRIVEGHGDLRAEHICLEEEPVIIDCLEFNRAFRIVDPVDELALLAVECARLGSPELGDAFQRAYTGVSGDAPGAELVAFYRGFRAFLRARIALWHLTDDTIRDHGRWIQRTREYLALALDFLPVK